MATRPQAWILFDDDGALLLDVNTSDSAVSFPTMIRLTDDDVASFAREGTAFISGLADDVQEHARTKYTARTVPAATQARADAAYTTWKA